MANYLKMAEINAIKALKERGWSYRHISRELGIHLDTARKYGQQDSKQVTKAPIGSDSDLNAATNAPLGSEPISKPASNAPLGSKAGTDPPPNRPSGTTSRCEPYRSIITGKNDLGLKAQRIYQDLVTEHGYTDSYYSVSRGASI
jgi:hypothetical protein